MSKEKKGIILPKKDKKTGEYYLSYSQMTTYKKSKREYFRDKLFGEGFDGNDYTNFGSEVGEALEHNDFKNFTLTEQNFLKTVPRYDEFEKKVRLNFEGFYLKGFVDTNSEDLTKIADYKTGDIEKKREEYKSDKYEQLDIYAAAIEQEFGVLPTDAKVFLIGRKGNAFRGEKLTLDKRYDVIDKVITPERIQTVKDNIQKTAEEISDYYKVFLKLQEYVKNEK